MNKHTKDHPNSGRAQLRLWFRDSFAMLRNTSCVDACEDVLHMLVAEARRYGDYTPEECRRLRKAVRVAIWRSGFVL